MSDSIVYVVLYRDYEGSSLLWAGIGRDAAIQAVLDARAGIQASVNAHKDLLGEYPDERDYETVTDEEWSELDRKQGPFSLFRDPERACVLREIGTFNWTCCCQELGVAISEPIIVGP